MSQSVRRVSWTALRQTHHAFDGLPFFFPPQIMPLGTNGCNVAGNNPSICIVKRPPWAAHVLNIFLFVRLLTGVVGTAVVVLLFYLALTFGNSTASGVDECRDKLVIVVTVVIPMRIPRGCCVVRSLLERQGMHIRHVKLG